MDVFAAPKRSYIMSRIRGGHTLPEMQVRSALHKLGLRFRLHKRDLPGRPDIVFGPEKLAVFVHGCFWHGHSCRRGARPTSNTVFWNAKLTKNAKRDQQVRSELRKLGWRTIVIWQCQLTTEAGRANVLRRVAKAVSQRNVKRTSAECSERR
jgi:DNA mismatch endonuclease, patch repair protein